MPCISRFFGITIYMYHDDHNPPHFHARYNGEEVQISLLDLAVVEGRVSRRALNLVIDWAELHRDELALNWQRARRGETLEAINPLE
jgi:hypothetical protein